MNILLTGSHGFIGRHVAQDLHEHKVFYWDQKIGKSLKKITNRDFIGIDVVIHLAAYISVPHSYEDPPRYLHNNTVVTQIIAEKAVRAGVKKFIFASSSSVYAKPLSPYGASKLSAEHVLEAYQDKMKIHRLRFFNVYGPGQNRDFPGVITKIINNLKEGTTFEINGDGSQSRDYTYVKDIAKIIKKLTESDLELEDPIDIGAGVTTSLTDLIAMLEKISGKTLLKRHIDPAKEIHVSQAVRTPKEVIENFTPLEVGLKETYET